MRVGVVSDHTCVSLRKKLVSELRALGYEVLDYGPESDKRTDYPVYGARIGAAVVDGDVELGIAICGSGVGMSMATNKIPGVRAACVSEAYSAAMSRKHNNANVLCFGGRLLNAAQALAVSQVWLETDYEGGRHQRRVEQLAQLDVNDLSFSKTEDQSVAGKSEF